MKYRIGLVGLGAFGEKYVRTITEQFPNIEIVVACRKQGGRPDFLPTNSYFTQNWHDIWEFSPDGIIVATTPEHHVEVALETVKRNVPAIIEKPICLRAEQLYDVPDDSKLLVNFIHLFAPAFNRLENLIANQKITSIATVGHNSGPERQFLSLFDYGSHDVAMILATLQQYPSRILCDRVIREAGDLFMIHLEFNNVRTYSVVGNGATNKRREFSAITNVGSRYSYNDMLADQKLSIVTKRFERPRRRYLETEFPEYDKTIKPLSVTISKLLAMIDGVSVGNIPLARQVVKILEECAAQTIKQ